MQDEGTWCLPAMLLAWGAQGRLQNDSGDLSLQPWEREDVRGSLASAGGFWESRGVVSAWLSPAAAASAGLRGCLTTAGAGVPSLGWGCGGGDQEESLCACPGTFLSSQRQDKACGAEDAGADRPWGRREQPPRKTSTGEWGGWERAAVTNGFNSWADTDRRG